MFHSTKTYSTDVRRSVGIFSNVNDSASQDAVLHRIFTSLLDELSHADPNDSFALVIETTMTLYRLYFADWSPARTYFYQLTGILIDPDYPCVDLSKSLLSFTPLTPILDPRTIHGECDKACGILNSLSYKSENGSSSGSGSSSEDGSSGDSSGDDDDDASGDDDESDESPNEDGDAESVETEDGFVDPRNLMYPQWTCSSADYCE